MNNNALKISISNQDIAEIKLAKARMEQLSWLLQGINKIGGTLETGLDKLPEKQQQWLQNVVENTLRVVVKSNLATMQKGAAFKKPSNKTYKALVTTTGATSGFFGAATGIGTVVFASELTISTKFMMRSIIDIARSEGEDITSIDTQLACLQVFTLGGKSKDDDALETSYYTTKIALSSAVKGASNYIAQHGSARALQSLLKSSSNPVMRLIAVVASRFSIQVSEKFIAQAIPVVGAVGGGSLNFLFLNHFQTIAKAHFTIRKLERKYSEDLVREVYENARV